MNKTIEQRLDLIEKHLGIQEQPKPVKIVYVKSDLTDEVKNILETHEGELIDLSFLLGLQCEDVFNSIKKRMAYKYPQSISHESISIFEGIYLIFYGKEMGICFGNSATTWKFTEGVIAIQKRLYEKLAKQLQECLRNSGKTPVRLDKFELPTRYFYISEGGDVEYGKPEHVLNIAENLAKFKGVHCTVYDMDFKTVAIYTPE